MRKRVLSLLLAICLVVGLLPPTVILAEPAAATESVTIKMNNAAISVTVEPGNVYYAKAANGTPYDSGFGLNTPGDGSWTMKLDNTKAPAELTLKNGGILLNNALALEISGNGALKIIVEGDFKIQSKNRQTTKFAMAGGTTITSVDNSKLSFVNTGTSAYAALGVSAGSLTLDNANVYASNNAHATNSTIMSAIYAKDLDVTVKGGNLEVESKNNGALAITAGNLTIQDNAVVTATSTGGSLSNVPVEAHQNARVGIRVSGNFAVSNSTLKVINQSGAWKYTLSKIPVITNAIAKYSTSAAGTDLLDLDTTSTDPVAHPYVEFAFACTSHTGGTATCQAQAICGLCGAAYGPLADHTYDNDTDTDCNVCAAVRPVAAAITATIGGKEVNAAIGEIWYATAAEGNVSDFTKEEIANWNIKLDNTKVPAELTLKSAIISNALSTIAGSGLKIIVDGNSEIIRKNGSVLTISMPGGTTITSVGESLLKIHCGSTSGYHALKVDSGSLTLDHAYTDFVTNTNRADTSVRYGIEAPGQTVSIIGGAVNYSTTNSGARAAGAILAGNLIISQGAVVDAWNDATITTALNDGVADNRYAINVSGDFIIDHASLTVANLNTNQDVWKHTLSKMPTLIGAKAQYSESATEIVLKDLTEAAGTKITHPYVAITVDCGDLHTYDMIPNPENPNELIEDALDSTCNYCGAVREVVCPGHQYDGPGDDICNLCKAEREVPKALTAIIDSITWNAVPGEVYYAGLDGTALKDLGVLAEAPEGWVIKLDNTASTAQLTLKGVTIKAAVSVEGAGALEIIVDGDSSITVNKSALTLKMTGGTTITSVNDSKLSVSCTTTSAYSAISASAGPLTFKNANVYLRNSAYASNSTTAPALHANDVAVEISGGKLDIETLGAAGKLANGALAIRAGSLTINNAAQVTATANSGNIENVPHEDHKEIRIGVNVTGDFVIDHASLLVANTSGTWKYTFGKMPTLTGAKAQYSESATEIVLKDLTEAAGTKITHPYVVITVDCGGNHTYDMIPNPENPNEFIENPMDSTCNYCGEVREVNCPGHQFDNPGDATCNYCGATREVPTALTATFGGITWNVAPGEVYYASMNGTALKDLGALAEAPEGWVIKLDNTKLTAELTLKGVTFDWKSSGVAMSMTGEGALTITVDGDSSITNTKNTAVSLAMAGGTTITSVNGSKLTVKASTTSAYVAISASAGPLTFKDANVYASNSAYASNSTVAAALSAANVAVTVDGGKLEIESTTTANRPANGALAIRAGSLTINKASVTATAGSGNIENVTLEPHKELRIGVNVSGDFVINEGSLIVMNTSGTWRYTVNKMPTLGSTLKAQYSASADGSNLQPLNPDDPAAKITHPYVTFAHDCNGNHTYDDLLADPDCNICGEIREVRYPLTVNFGAVKWDVALNEIYYATTDKDGKVTDYGTSNPGEGNWNIKLDNTEPTAVLTLKGAKIEWTEVSAAVSLSGDGKLKIVVDGDTTIKSTKYSAFVLKMAGGTTITSGENGGKLSASCTSTSAYTGMSASVGPLTLDNADIYVRNSAYAMNSTTAPAFHAGSIAVTIKGGKLVAETISAARDANGALAISAGSLSLTDHAVVTATTNGGNLENVSIEAHKEVRIGVKVAGAFVIDNSTLRISNKSGAWRYTVNKMPTLTGSIAQYSENAENLNLQALNPEDPTAGVTFPYVQFVVNCTEHVWSNAADPDCNICGEIRSVPYDINVAFQFGATELVTLIWEAKVGEVYYATTNENGQIIDLGKRTSEPAKWNIKLDNTKAEAVLTLRDANIIRKVRQFKNNERDDTAFGLKVGTMGTITTQGTGSLRILTEKASTITTDEAYACISTNMAGGTTFSSKDNAKLSIVGTRTCVTGGIVERVGNLTFDHANVYVEDGYTSKKLAVSAVSAAKNMTVIGGRVEIIADMYATSGLTVKGNLTVQDNAILIVSTGSKAGASGTSTTTVYGVDVKGDITINDSTLMVKRYGKYWAYSMNKMPALVKAEAYNSETSTKDSKLVAFTKDAGTDLKEMKSSYMYFSNAKPGTLVDESVEEEDDDDEFFFEDVDNPFTGDTVSLALLFILVTSSAAALVVLYNKKRAQRK